MIKSLTGFGSVELSDKSNQISIIIRSVNARFLDIKFRGIDLDPQFELDIRKEIQKKLVRGNINIQIYLKNGGKTGTSLKFDKDRFEAVENVVGQVQRDYGKHLNLSELISINDLITSKEIDEIDNSLILKGIKDTISQVDDMRINEGSEIYADIKNRIDIIKSSLKKLKSESGKFVKQLNKEYRERIQALLEGVNVDNDRIAQEIVIQVDKFDFTEELVRGLSHCEQFLQFIKSNEPVGKKLNFLLQELSREVNTIGSKSPTSMISNVVVEIKSEVEKIREQIQNIL